MTALSVEPELPPVPNWPAIRAIVGDPSFVPAPPRYPGFPLQQAIAERLDEFVRQARIDPANGHLTDRQLEVAVTMAVAGPNRFDPPYEVWAAAVHAADTHATRKVPPWQAVLLFGCGGNRGGRPSTPSANGWCNRWSFSIQQLREIVRQDVQYGIKQIESWGKLRFDDDVDRQLRVDDLVELVTLSLIAGGCPCSEDIQPRHVAKRAARCAREHSIAGWVLGGRVTLGNAVLQAVVGTANLRTGMAPWLARGMLFAALRGELTLGAAAFWKCPLPRCAEAGDMNYWAALCQGPCKLRLALKLHRVRTVDDQLVNFVIGTRVAFVRCICQNEYRLLVAGKPAPACPICSVALKRTTRGNWPRCKRAWI